MLTVHNLENSRSIRILWLLEELGIDYEIKHYKRHKLTKLAQDDYKKLHPVGKSPVVSDGELALAETGAIVEYIIERYGEGKLRPAKDDPNFVQYLYWLHSAEGSLMPLLLLKMMVVKLVEKTPFPARPIAKAATAPIDLGYISPSLKKLMSYLNSELEKSKWLAGNELSAADVMVSFAVDVAGLAFDLKKEYPAVHRFDQEYKERDAYKRALEKNGPYDLDL